jgi:hypothetical protein
MAPTCGHTYPVSILPQDLVEAQGWVLILFSTTFLLWLALDTAGC